jgi:flagellar hook-basal body complex protein FliE
MVAVAPIASDFKAIASLVSEGRMVAKPGALPTFASFLEDSSKESLNLQRGAERLTGEALMGKADLTDVTTAVSSAEITLQTIVSLRDRLVASVQEIMRMPV